MQQFDLIVIGAGPGGYIAAIRAAQLGLNVAVVEREPALGGTCLRVGCIPSKALLESSEKFAEVQHDLAQHGVRVSGVKLDLAAMRKRKDEIVTGLTGGVDMLMKKNKITRISGHARIAGAVGGQSADTGRMYRVDIEPNSDKDKAAELAAPRIIIAVGSRVANLPGVDVDYDRIGTSTEALDYPEVPEHLVVIGAGFIGLELGSVWARLGAKVTVLEFLPRILPGMDTEVAAAALKLFQKQGIEFRLSCKVTRAYVDQGGKSAKTTPKSAKAAKSAGKGAAAPACVVETESGEPIRCDRVLLAVGRVPNTDDCGLESLGIERDKRGRIIVNEHLETAAPGVFAIGDAIAGPMLAHKAEEEGVAVAEYIVTGYGHVNYDAIPGIAYTQPEVAAVGKTEDDLKAENREYRKGVFHFRGNGRARALAQTDGFVKILADAKTDRVLGVHIIGPRAGDLIAEAVAAIEFGASAEDIARTCHAHPTLAEVVKEAALSVDKRTLNG